MTTEVPAPAPPEQPTPSPPDAPQPDRQAQVAHQLGNDPNLLGVLLTEIGDVRLHDVEELEHHRRNAPEVARPEGLGATGFFTVLQDLEGNEFCVH